jgi:hypothetical protein
MYIYVLSCVAGYLFLINWRCSLAKQLLDCEITVSEMIEIRKEKEKKKITRRTLHIQPNNTT